MLFSKMSRQDVGTRSSLRPTTFGKAKAYLTRESRSGFQGFLITALILLLPLGGLFLLLRWAWRKWTTSPTSSFAKFSAKLKTFPLVSKVTTAFGKYAGAPRGSTFDASTPSARGTGYAAPVPGTRGTAYSSDLQLGARSTYMPKN